MPAAPTAQPTAAAVTQAIRAIAETIRTAGEIPSGHLYAVLMNHGCTLATYERIVDMLIDANLIERTPAHLLRWIGPKH